MILQGVLFVFCGFFAFGLLIGIVVWGVESERRQEKPWSSWRLDENKPRLRRNPRR